MTDFMMNKAGAKIYKDISKHEFLKIPLLVNDKAKGIVHEVLSLGILGPQREPIITIKKTGKEVIAYRLPKDLQGWVEHVMLQKVNGVNLLPAKFEFGKLNGRTYAEML